MSDKADFLIRNVDKKILTKFRNATMLAKIERDSSITQKKMFEIMVEQWFSDQKDEPIVIKEKKRVGLRDLGSKAVHEEELDDLEEEVKIEIDQNDFDL